jgi:hypothetical protein
MVGSAAAVVVLVLSDQLTPKSNEVRGMRRGEEWERVEIGKGRGGKGRYVRINEDG